MAEQTGKFLTELPELTTPIEDDLMYIVDDDTSKRITLKNLKSVVGGEDVTGTASGAVATFIDGGDDKPMKSLVVDVEATQSGSGTPSPSNVRPIVGRSEVNITVSDGENDNVTTIPLDRTVYGGTLDVTRGELTDTVGDLISFSSANTNVWSGVATSTQGVTRFYTTPSYAGRTLLQADSYELSPNYNTQTDIITTSVDGRIIITPTFGQGKTLEEFKALLATYPFNIKMTLAAPQTYTLTPEEVSTILGYNNISADSGDVSVVYVRDLDITINDLINRVTALENE